MNDQPTQDLATRAFQKRVLDEFAAVRQGIAAFQVDLAEIRTQQAAMARNIAALDQRVTAIDERLTSLEQRVDARLQETRPIWEAVQAQLRKLIGKFELVLEDLVEVRLDIRGHEHRLNELENKPA